MYKPLFALASLMTAALPSVASADETVPPVEPAAVAVAFNRELIEPLIVEGLADRSTGRAVKANDPVRIASISKLVMALAAMRLVDEGKIDLDADVSDYLGWKLRNPSYPDVPITLAQIMSHRSSLRDGADYIIPLGDSLQEKLADPRAWYADAPPGEAPFEYANIGSPVAATVLEAASGERYDRLLERTVFAPLGINACLNWVGCSQEQVDRAVVLYRSTGEVARDDAADRPPHCAIPVAKGVACTLDDYVPGTNASVFSPQGGVRIGMMDLAKLGQAIMLSKENGLLSDETVMRWGSSAAETYNGDQSFFCFYGYHLQMIQEFESGCVTKLFGGFDDPHFDDPYFGHAGEAYGLRSGLWFDARGNKGLAYFVTAVPDRTSEEEGGFAAEEIELVRRAVAMQPKEVEIEMPCMEGD